MKAVLSIFLSIFAFSASALPELQAQKSTCAEMQEALANYGEAKIISRNLLIKRTTFVYEKIRCNALEMKVQGIFRSKDVFSCEVGYYCKRDRSAGAGCYPGNNPGRCN